MSGEASNSQVTDRGSEDLTRTPKSKASSNQSAGEQKKRISVIGDFIKVEKEPVQDAEPAVPTKRSLGSWAAWFATSYHVGNFMAGVVIVDAACTWVDIDARASDGAAPAGAIIFLDVSLALYSFELLMVFLSQGLGIVLKDGVVFLDATVVFCGYLEIVLNVLGPTDVMARLQIMRALRLARIFRLLKLFRRIRALRELQKLVTMMATCLRTLVWSFLLCFVCMTIWAMLLVELVYPIILDMPDTFAECEYCQISTRSVMSANLLLFKTVIAGDGWGEVAIPVISREPWTAVIFVGSLLTLIFGVLNIIIAVVVDTFAEARQNDVVSLAWEMENDSEKNKAELTELFTRLDKDGSGQLSLEELMMGARRDPVLQSRLRVMDIDENDLQQLFCMIDVDNSGTIEAAEFIGPLSRWVHDSKTAPRFIKYNMLQTMQMQEDLYNLSEQRFRDLSQHISALSECVDAMRSKWGQSSMSTLSYSVGQVSQGFRDAKPPWKTDEGAAIEQPATCNHPKMMQPSPASSLAEDFKNQNYLADPVLLQLLDGAVAKVELGMMDMENRLQKAFASTSADGPSPVEPKASHRTSRGDLFRAVYGEAKLRQRHHRAITAATTQLALPESLPKMLEEDVPVRHTKSTD